MRYPFRAIMEEPEDLHLTNTLPAVHAAYSRSKTLSAFQIITGWWGHQPGGCPALGGVSTAHMKQRCDNLKCHKISLFLSMVCHKKVIVPLFILS
jgi:hypothetical protein